MNKKPRGMFAFFATPIGRKVVFYAAGTTTGALFLGNYLPHTFGLEYYKNFVQCYTHGIAHPVSEQIQKRIEKAFNILELTPLERKLIKPFSVFGFDLFHAGATKYRFGAKLGIPVNYEYASADDINRSNIKFRDESISWSSTNGKLLEEAIVLTEDEQIFGLCKAILQLRTHHVFLNAVFPSLSFFMVYSLGHYLNHRLNLFQRHISMRLVLYSILGLFGYGSWCFMKDFNQVSYDADIDKKLSSLGPEFVEAGMRFYEKQLKKNIALRNLIGDDTYTALGNENYLLRQKSMPLTARKSFFELKWQELQQSATQTTEESQ